METVLYLTYQRFQAKFFRGLYFFRQAGLAAFLLFWIPVWAMGQATLLSVTVSNANPVQGSTISVTVTYDETAGNTPNWMVGIIPSADSNLDCNNPADNQYFLVDANTGNTGTSPVVSTTQDTNATVGGWAGIPAGAAPANPLKQIFTVTLPAGLAGGTYKIVVQEAENYVNCASGNSFITATVTLPALPTPTVTQTFSPTFSPTAMSCGSSAKIYVVSDTTNMLWTDCANPGGAPPPDASGNAWNAGGFNFATSGGWISSVVVNPLSPAMGPPCNVAGSGMTSYWLSSSAASGAAAPCGVTFDYVKNFNIPPGSAVSGAVLSVEADDGNQTGEFFGIWVNGNALSGTGVVWNACTSIAVPAADFLNGYNVLAIHDGNGYGSYQGMNYILSFTLTAPTCTPTFTNTATSTATNTSTNTLTNTPTNTLTHTATNTPTNTFTNSSTNTVTNTATNTPTLTLTNTFTNTPTDTLTNSPTNTPTNTATNTVTLTFTNTDTNTPTSSPTDTATNTPTSSPLPTNTATNSATNTSTNTSTNTPTLTSTNSPTPTNTATNTPTNTRTNTATNTVTNTQTNTPINTSTNTPTHTATATATNTPTNSATNTATQTPTFTATGTATNTATATPRTGLAMAKQVSETTAKTGDLLTYSIAVTVTGNSAFNVVVTDTLPAGLTFESFGNVPAGTVTIANGPNLKWTLPSPLAIGVYQLTYQAQVGTSDAGDRVTNRAQLTSASAPPINSSVPVQVLGVYTVSVNIYNSAGEVVKTILVQSESQPINNITLGPSNVISTLQGPGNIVEIFYNGTLIGTWDGSNNGGNPVTNGNYEIQVDSTSTSGVVTSVNQRVTVNRDLSNVTVTIYNSTGEVVRTLYNTVTDWNYSQTMNMTLNANVIQPGGRGPGAAVLQMVILNSGASVTLIWDGTNNQGTLVTPGTYRVQCEWNNGEGQGNIIRPVIVMGAGVSGTVAAEPNILQSGQTLTTTFNAAGIPNAWAVNVKIYTIAGQLVASRDGEPGTATVPWAANGMASGLYIAAVQVQDSNGGVLQNQMLKVLVLH